MLKLLLKQKGLELMLINKAKYNIWKVISSDFLIFVLSRIRYGRFLLITARRKIKNHIVSEYFSDFVVKNGPFSSMKLLRINNGFDSILPKLFGTYEFEIHQIVNQIIKNRHDYIINIGCAEGYYLVGFALKIPTCQLIGFESEVCNQEFCRQNSILNSVSDRIKIMGYADESSILGLESHQNMLFFSDCEGAELDVFTDKVIQKFRNSDFLIETHDCFRPGMTEQLIRRFTSTHYIQIVDFITNDKRAEFSKTTLPLSKIEKYYLVEERREKNNGWIYCVAKK